MSQHSGRFKSAHSRGVISQEIGDRPDPRLGPGFVISGVAGSKPEDVAAGAASASVTGRFTNPTEVANAVIFLASDRSGNTTGANIIIDGGLITTL